MASGPSNPGVSLLLSLSRLNCLPIVDYCSVSLVFNTRERKIERNEREREGRRGEGWSTSLAILSAHSTME